MIEKYFLAHPRSVDESYGEHLLAAASFSFDLLRAGLACFVHAIVPGLFVTTGSQAVSRLHDRMVRNRNRTQQGVTEPLAKR